MCDQRSQPPTRLSGLNSVAYSRTTTSEQPPVPLHSAAICNSWIRASTLRAYFSNQLRLHTATQVQLISLAHQTRWLTLEPGHILDSSRSHRMHACFVTASRGGMRGAPATHRCMFQAIDAVGWQLTGAELAALRTQCVVV